LSDNRVLKKNLKLKGCELYGFVGGLSGTTAIMSIALMSSDRYRVISNPLNPRISKRVAISLSLSIWIYSLMFSAPPLFGLMNRYVPEGYLTSCSYDYLSRDFISRMYIFVFFIGAFCLPMVIIAYSYIGIVFVVKRSRLVLNELKNDSQSSSLSKFQNKKNNEIKLAKIAFCLITLWVLSWSPYAIVSLIGIFYDQSFLTPTVSMLPALFAKASSFINPLVYALSHPKFKEEVKKRIFKTAVTSEDRTENYHLTTRGGASTSSKS
jgi:r-opsin